MGLIEVKEDFSKRELMWFGPLMALFMGILGWIVIQQFAAHRLVYAVWAATGLLIVVYYLFPAAQRAIFRGWILALLPIGWVVSHLLLALIYYLLLTPIGLLMKLFRYDPMHRKFDKSADSYWVPRDTARDKSRYFKQY